MSSKSFQEGAISPGLSWQERVGKTSRPGISATALAGGSASPSLHPVASAPSVPSVRTSAQPATVPLAKSPTRPLVPIVGSPSQPSSVYSTPSLPSAVPIVGAPSQPSTVYSTPAKPSAAPIVGAQPSTAYVSPARPSAVPVASALAQPSTTPPPLPRVSISPSPTITTARTATSPALTRLLPTASSPVTEYGEELIRKAKTGTLEPKYKTFLDQVVKTPSQSYEKVQHVAKELGIRTDHASELLDVFILNISGVPESDESRAYFTSDEVSKLASVLGLRPASDKLANVLMIRDYLKRIEPASPQ